MRSLFKVGIVVMVAIVSAGACGREGARDSKNSGFDADQYVEEEFRDLFEVEENAGAAHRLPEQALLPNVG